MAGVAVSGGGPLNNEAHGRTRMQGSRFGALLIVVLLVVSTPSAADVPTRFVGKWTIEVEAQPGFPWWSQIAYPVALEITASSAEFTDQRGTGCRPPTFFYDEEIGMLVFNHHLPTKSEGAIAPFYRAKVEFRTTWMALHR